MPVLDDLLAHLATTLPPEVAEVLLPACHLAEVPGGVRADLRHATWLEAWRELGAPAAERFLAAQGLTLISRAEAAEVATGDHAQTFASFLADPGTQLALAACRRVVEAPGIDHNPLYLHGGSGTGKSHLLAAVAHEFRTMLGEGAVVALDGPAFVAAHAQELSRREDGPLRQALAQAACITIDGIDTLAGRDLAQEELFHLLNDALDRGVQLVIAGRLPPQRLAPLTERLASRLAWGLVLGLEAPRLETRIAVVRSRGGPVVQALDPAVLAGLVEARAPDLHQAIALADHLAHHGTGPRTTEAGFDRILAVVAAHFDLRPGDLTGKRRDRATAIARGLALLLGRRLTGHSLQALGGMVGGRDHATVLHALHSTEERLAADPALQRTYDSLAAAVLK